MDGGLPSGEANLGMCPVTKGRSLGSSASTQGCFGSPENDFIIRILDDKGAVKKIRAVGLEGDFKDSLVSGGVVCRGVILIHFAIVHEVGVQMGAVAKRHHS